MEFYSFIFTIMILEDNNFLTTLLEINNIEVKLDKNVPNN